MGLSIHLSNMTKEQILRIVEIKVKIMEVERTDVDKKNIIESGSYALSEGYITRHMEQIEKLEQELENI